MSASFTGNGESATVFPSKEALHVSASHIVLFFSGRHSHTTCGRLLLGLHRLLFPALGAGAKRGAPLAYLTMCGSLATRNCRVSTRALAPNAITAPLPSFPFVVRTPATMLAACRCSSPGVEPFYCERLELIASRGKLSSHAASKKSSPASFLSRRLRTISTFHVVSVAL